MGASPFRCDCKWGQEDGGSGYIVLAATFCYYKHYGSYLNTQILLLPVEQLRRVYELVSDLPAQIDPEDTPVAD